MIEASFMTDDGEILQKRMVDEDRLFESYCNRRTLRIANRKVVVCGCSYIAEPDQVRVEVQVREVR